MCDIGCLRGIGRLDSINGLGDFNSFDDTTRLSNIGCLEFTCHLMIQVKTKTLVLLCDYDQEEIKRFFE